MSTLRVDNYIIDTPIIEILRRLQLTLSNGKLHDIKDDKLDEIVVTCPNDEHSGGHESHPDCHINLDSSNGVPYGYFHCFACGVKGTFVKFVALCFSSSESYARTWLKNNYGKETKLAVSLDPAINLHPVKQAPKFLDESVLDQYQPWSPYLAKRKLSRETCANFKVRYDPVYRQVIFPVFDIKNRLKMLARRNIDTKVFYMDEGQEKEVYGLNIIQKNNINKCLITEGPIDMLTGWTHGIPTIASLGTISDYQIAQINKSCITSLYLAFDNDAAGRRFTETVKKKLAPRIITTEVEFPKYRKDLNDLSEEDWQSLINKYFNEYKK